MTSSLRLDRSIQAEKAAVRWRGWPHRLSRWWRSRTEFQGGRLSLGGGDSAAVVGVPRLTPGRRALRLPAFPTGNAPMWIERRGALPEPCARRLAGVKAEMQQLHPCQRAGRRSSPRQGFAAPRLRPFGTPGRTGNDTPCCLLCVL